MNTLSLHHASHLRIGFAAVSAALLTLLGGPQFAYAQSPAPNSGLSLPGQAIPKPTPLTLQQMQAARPASARPLSLPTIPYSKHPVAAPVRLAKPLDLSGPPVTLQGHVPGLTAHAIKLHPVPPNQDLTITFFLRPRNKAQMDDLVKRLYDLKDPLFHRFLKPAERIAHFSPSQDDFNMVVAFAQRSGLRITNSSIARRWLQATGTVCQVEKTLGVHLDNYKAEDGTGFYAPDTDPKVPPAIAPVLSCIEQLDNIQPHSNAILRPASLSGGAGGAGGGVQPADIGIWNGIGMPAAEIKDYYVLAYAVDNTVLNGVGQRVALVELGGYNQSDIDYYVYYNTHLANPTTNLANTPLQIHGSDVGINTFSKECELDIEMLEAVADGLDNIDVYEVDPTQYTGTVDAAMDTILNDDADNQVSVSYDSSEWVKGQYSALAFNDTTELMALQGQAVFVSSGDWGSTNWAASGSTTGLDVNYYAASPYVTGVGGTTVYINETNSYGAYNYETSWSNGAYGGGGGISHFTAIPDYQSNYLYNDPNLGTIQASLSYRNVPDVALNADVNTGYYTHLLGQDTIAGGTSASAPLWAGFWAQLNQYRALYGISTMGFGNPALYHIAAGSNYNTDFHDIVIGDDNGYNAQNGYYPYYGYDLTTGLGSLDGVNLIYDLVNTGSWSTSEGLSIINSYGVTSGNPVQMSLSLNPPVPNYGSATVYWMSWNGSSWSQLGYTSLGGGAVLANAAFPAPDVSSSTQQIYACKVDYGGNKVFWSNQASVTVYPNTISSFSAGSPAYDGQSVTFTITLTAPAAQNEQIDLVCSDPNNIPVPASVTVSKGAQSAIFTVTTKLVSTSEQVTITANPDSAGSGLGSGSASAQVTVASLLSSLKLSSSSLTGGKTDKGTVYLKGAAPAGGAVISLNSSNAAASVPASVTVSAGATSATFLITTTAVSTVTNGAITATHFAASKSTTLKVIPIGVSSLSLSSTSVVGGTSLTAKVTLTAPAAPGSITVTLSSSKPSAAYPTVSSLTIPAGSTTGSFTVKTNTVSATSSVNITSAANGSSKSKTLQVNP